MKEKMWMIAGGVIPVVSLADVDPSPSCLGQISDEALFWVCLIAVASLCVAFLVLRLFKRRGIPCEAGRERDRKEGKSDEP